jgi:hypothetical protein
MEKYAFFLEWVLLRTSTAQHISVGNCNFVLDSALSGKFIQLPSEHILNRKSINRIYSMNLFNRKCFSLRMDEIGFLRSNITDQVRVRIRSRTQI